MITVNAGGGILVNVDRDVSWYLRDRGWVYQGTIERINGGRMSMADFQRNVVGCEIAGIGKISGVEMFCVDQRVGMAVGLLVENIK